MPVGTAIVNRCIMVRRNGQRCKSQSLTGTRYCTVHGGRNPSQEARAANLCAALQVPLLGELAMMVFLTDDYDQKIRARVVLGGMINKVLDRREAFLKREHEQRVALGLYPDKSQSHNGDSKEDWSLLSDEELAVALEETHKKQMSKLKQWSEDAEASPDFKKENKDYNAALAQSLGEKAIGVCIKEAEMIKDGSHPELQDAILRSAKIATERRIKYADEGLAQMDKDMKQPTVDYGKEVIDVTPPEPEPPEPEPKPPEPEPEPEPLPIAASDSGVSGTSLFDSDDISLEDVQERIARIRDKDKPPEPEPKRSTVPHRGSGEYWEGEK